MSLSRDQKRRKKLAERQRRQNTRPVSASIPAGPTVSKDKIAAILHQAVCLFTGDDGLGHCAHYAVAGSRLVSILTGMLYIPQAGNLQIFCDGDQGLMMDAGQGGVRSGEFHSWIVGPVRLGEPGQRRIPPEMEVIDFSSRHYRRYVEEHPKINERISLPGGVVHILDTESPKLTWRLPDPPNYIWTPFKNLPNWLRITADKEATAELFAHLDEFESLCQSAIQILRGSK